MGTESYSNKKIQLMEAVQYAIDTNYSAFDIAIRTNKMLRNAKTVCVFGMGEFFEKGYPYVEKLLHAQYVCDNNIEKLKSQKKNSYGLKCISVDELTCLKDVLVVIMLGGHADEVRAQLDALKIDNIHVGDVILNMYTKKHDNIWFLNEKENILAAMDLFEDDVSKKNYVEIVCNRIAPSLGTCSFERLKTGGEYFETGLLKFGQEEIYVDVGAYDGDTVEAFFDAVRGGVKQVYAFELDEAIYKHLVKKREQWDTNKVEIWNKGVSSVSENERNMVCLDDIFINEDISFIKMDIEGYEWDALHGAEKTIKRCVPQMAICLYHKLEDLWRIPLYIESCNSGEYQLFLRHHSPVVWDSVLYVRRKNDKKK